MAARHGPFERRGRRSARHLGEHMGFLQGGSADSRDYWYAVPRRAPRSDLAVRALPPAAEGTTAQVRLTATSTTTSNYGAAGYEGLSRARYVEFTHDPRRQD